MQCLALLWLDTTDYPSTFCIDKGLIGMDFHLKVCCGGYVEWVLKWG